MATPVEEIVDGSWNPLWRSFVRAMRAEKMSRHTMETYAYGLARFQDFLKASYGQVPPATAVTKGQVEEFLVHLDSTRSPKTVHNRFGGLRRWFRWLVDEGEMADSPMERMKPPRLPTKAPEVLDENAVRRLLGVCSGRDFRSRRDAALIRFLVDTGARRGATAGMTTSSRDLDLDHQVARVVEKGRKEVPLAFGDKAARDLDRYLRVRALHPHANTLVPIALGGPTEMAPALWIGQHGPMTGSGIYQVVRSRAQEAGLGQRVFTHIFRSTFADMWLDGGGQEGDLMTLAGWDSEAMLRRYTKRRAVDRARSAHRRLSPGDRI